MGRLLTESLAARDYPVVMAAFVIMAVLIIVRNLMADICHGIVDPRIRLRSRPDRGRISVSTLIIQGA